MRLLQHSFRAQNSIQSWVLNWTRIGFVSFFFSLSSSNQYPLQGSKRSPVQKCFRTLLYWTALGLVGFDPTTSRSQGCDQLLCYNHWPFPLVSSSLHKLWSSDFEIKCIIILPIFYGTSKKQLPSSNHSRPNKTAIKVGFIFWTKPQFPFWISVQDRTV